MRRDRGTRPAGQPDARPRRVRLDFVVDAHGAGQRLDALVLERLAQALGEAPSKSQVRTLIVAGVVRVAGQGERRAGRVLAAGTRVRADVDLARLRDRARLERARDFQVDARTVLYEDDALIALDKPAGLAIHPTIDERRPHLVGLTKAYLARGRALPEEPYLGVHQRLDRDTSGVVVFTKQPRANASLARQFERRQVEKTYHALAVRPRGPLLAAWCATTDIVGPAGALPARTDVRVVATLAHTVLIEARPHTGRKHQIRIHLADAGLPILGDTRYGLGRRPRGPQPPVLRMMLHACRLVLAHPLTGARLVIESPYPSDFAVALAAARAQGGALHDTVARPGD